MQNTPPPPADTLILRQDNTAALQHFFTHFLTPDMTVYDIGCGTKPFKDFLHTKVAAYLGIDIENGFYDSSHIDIIGSAENIPLADNVADAAISSQVLEHLPNPYIGLAEAARILKPNGLLFLSCPFLYPIHAAPYDFHRFTKHALEPAFSKFNLEPVAQHTHAGFWYCMNQFVMLYCSGFNCGLIKKLKIVPAVTFILRQIFKLFHTAEGFYLRQTGKDPAISRQAWAVNYVYVLKKKN